MNELLKTMAKDMGIQFYDDESLASFAYRIIYSALGLWCLHFAASMREGVYGMSKKGLTRAVNDLLKDKIAKIGENIKIRRFVRYEVGEGLEKREEDFAAEVAKQMGK